MTINITITDSAYSYIKKMLVKEQGVGFRLSIKKTGCSGYSYAPTVIHSVKANDLVIEKNDVKIFIDPAWLSTLQGLRVDYSEDSKSGLKQKRLIFTNPNEAIRCGCGESFHLT